MKYFLFLMVTLIANIISPIFGVQDDGYALWNDVYTRCTDNLQKVVSYSEKNPQIILNKYEEMKTIVENYMGLSLDEDIDLSPPSMAFNGDNYLGKSCEEIFLNWLKDVMIQFSEELFSSNSFISSEQPQEIILNAYLKKERKKLVQRAVERLHASVFVFKTLDEEFTKRSRSRIRFSCNIL